MRLLGAGVWLLMVLPTNVVFGVTTSDLSLFNKLAPPSRFPVLLLSKK